MKQTHFDLLTSIK